MDNEPLDGDRGWKTFDANQYGLADPNARPDPYFIWAVATKFANFPRYGRPDGVRTIQVIVELAADSSVGELRAAIEQSRSKAKDKDAADGYRLGDIKIPELYPDDSRYCTADVLSEFFEWTANQSASAVVGRVEMCVPVAPADNADKREPKLTDVQIPQSETPVLLGAIDDGCAFAHESLAGDDQACRVLAIWDQEPDPRRSMRAPYRPEGDASQLDDVIRSALVQFPPIRIDADAVVTHPEFRVQYYRLGKYGASPSPLPIVMPLHARKDRTFIAQQPPRKSLRGVQITREQIQSLLGACKVHHAVDEDACYQAMCYASSQGSLTHGMHVLSLMAGRRSLAASLNLRRDRAGTSSQIEANDRASRSDIVFVQMPRAELHDPSGLWLGASVLDGVHYICDCAGNQTERVVVNVSYGPQHGPHDGTSILERALADFVVAQMNQHQRELAIVLPAGNGFMSRGHASVTIQEGESKAPPLHWRILPDTDTPSFLEIWLPPEAAGALQVEVVPPGARSSRSVPVTAGSARMWTGAVKRPGSHGPQCGIIFAHQVSRGLKGTMILVAVSPTVARHAGDAVAPHGLWSIHLGRRDDVAAGTRVDADAYVVRNDVNLGGRRPRRQSYLVDDAYDADRWWRAAPDDERDSAAQVRRRGTLSGIACASSGSGIHVVGGYRLSDGQPCSDSAAGPARELGRVGPDCCAAMDQSAVMRGMPASGTRSGSIVRLRGTSMAAPQLARRLANARLPSERGQLAAQGGQAPMTQAPVARSPIAEPLPDDADRPEDEQRLIQRQGGYLLLP